MAAPASQKHASDRDFHRGLRISMILHGGLFVFILLKSIVFPGNPVPILPSLRVDLVGLPDQLKNETLDKRIAQALKQAEEEAKSIKPLPKPPEAKPAETADKAEKDELVLKPKRVEETKAERAKEKAKQREKRLKSALNRIKALDKITSELNAKKKESSSGVLIKGNRISKGTSLSGDARETDQASYYDHLRDTLQSNWELPVWIARQNLSAQVQIFIDGRGRVRNYRFVRTSGNAQFDDAVKRTIIESQPFSPPPESIASTALVDGILVGFPL